MLAKSEIDEDNTAEIKHVVGWYDLKLQIDIWCRTKPERYKIYELFFEAINPVIKPMGLSLQLSSYHNLYARYDMVGYSFGDNEQGSQRSEWRVKIEVLANCKAVRVDTEFMITEPIELKLTTPDTI